MNLWSRIRKTAIDLADEVFDEIAFVDDSLLYANPDDRDEETLDLPGYKQTQSYTCGWVAGLMALHCYDARRSPSKLWDHVSPHPKLGTSTAKLVKGLRCCGVDAKTTTRLTWEKVRVCISSGEPILLSVKTDQRDTLHWVALYGVNHRTRHVFVAGNGIPYLNYVFRSQKITWANFYKLWEPKGEAIICKGYEAP